MDVRYFPALDDVHALRSHDWPDVLSIWCLTRGCGRLVEVWSSSQAKHIPARSMMAVAYSRSLMDMRGGERNCSVFSRIFIGHGKWKNNL